MNANSLLLTLYLTLLLTPLYADPLNHLGNVLKRTTSQLSALSNVGYNNQNFSSMVALLNNLFANMQVLSEPYFNNAISQITDQNEALLAQIIALEAQIQAQTSVAFTYLDSAGTVLASQVNNIGNIIIQFQNTIFPQLDSIQIETANMNSQVQALASLQNDSENSKTAINTGIAQMVAQQAFDQIEFDTVINLFPKIDKIDTNDLTLISTDLNFCKAFTYQFANSYIDPPQVYGSMVSQAEPNSVAQNGMDIVLISNSKTSANLMICDRSYNTFTLIHSWVEITIYSVDVGQ